TAIDVRHKGDRVRAFVQRSGIPRVFPVFGVVGGQTFLATPRRPDRHGIRAHAVDQKLAKDIIFARLKLENQDPSLPCPRYMHFPQGQGYNEDYFLQLTGEVLETKFEYGFPKTRYEKTRPRNEALDIRVYLLACVDILKPSLTRIATNLRAPGAQV